MKKWLMLLLVSITVNLLSGYEMLRLGDIPTAGILQQGEVQIDTKIYHQNGIMVGSSVGIFRKFMFGISYGGENIVGNQKPSFNEKIEVNAKYRLFDEGPSMPAIVLGFDTQGHGRYYPSVKRYDIKSKGFYAVASRNYLMMGNLGIHVGTNYSLENKDKQKHLNLFFGIDKSFGEDVVFMLDYDAALNDIKPEIDEQLVGLDNRKGNGFLNLSLLLRFSESLAIRLIAYDVLENNRLTATADRSITINYNMKF